MDEGDTSTVKYNGVYYVCKRQDLLGLNGSSTDTLIRWGVAPDIYNKTFDLRDSCAAGKMYDGSVITGNSGNYYVCDAGTFKEVKYADLKSMKACVSYNQDHIYKSVSTFFKCTASGWTSVSDGAKGELRIESQTYNTVIIGGQHWMAENLNRVTKGSSCYGGLSSNCSEYGRLYTLEGAQEACPAGWRLPLQSDLSTLVATAGGEEEGGYRLKTKTGWYNSGNGWNDFSFSVKPAGHMIGSTSSYANIEKNAYIWSNSSYYTGMNYILKLDYSNKKALLDFNGTSNGFSVRCIQD